MLETEAVDFMGLMMGVDMGMLCEGQTFERWDSTNYVIL